MIHTFPPPLSPTSASVFPAGTEKFSPYVKVSKTIRTKEKQRKRNIKRGEDKKDILGRQEWLVVWDMQSGPLETLCFPLLLMLLYLLRAQDRLESGGRSVRR